MTFVSSICKPLVAIFASAPVDKFVWNPKIAALLVGKVLSRPVVAHVERLPLYRARYRFLVEDSLRTILGADELCSLRWSFRFKEPAGEFWLSLDPYWTVEPYGSVSYQRMFSPDGTVVSLPSQENGVGMDSLDAWARELNMTIKWRFTASRLGKKGHFLQVRVCMCEMIGR